MAETRAYIKEVVELNVGRHNDALENKLCDEALKIALNIHPFDDAISQPSDFTITEDATSVSIASVSDVMTIVTARIVQADGDFNDILKMKNRTWWDRNVVNPEDNQKGWPKYGLHFGTDIILDRPAESNLELRLRLTTKQTFTNDNTECPIALLDGYVIKYVTAGLFKQLKHFEAAKEWRKEALGPFFDMRGEPGGLLLVAINLDKANIAEEMQLRQEAERKGIPIQNLITDHDDYGNIRTWH